MDENCKKVMELRIQKTMKSLEQNNMKPYYAPTKEDAVTIVESILKEGEIISCGGSMTLRECGIRALMSSGKYKFLDRDQAGLSREDIEEIYRKTFSADTFLTSANAITENGELFNVDGNSNRVAAIVFGPKSVIVVAGLNKIVPSLEDAIIRVKKIAAPANGCRLHTGTPCEKTGECVSCTLGKASEMTDGCQSPGRMCCSYVVSAAQRTKDRIKVILVGEPLGY